MEHAEKLAVWERVIKELERIAFNEPKTIDRLKALDLLARYLFKDESLQFEGDSVTILDDIQGEEKSEFLL